MNEELKPCPFCGNKNIKLIDTEGMWEGDNGYIVVQCEYDHNGSGIGCGASGQFSSNKKIAAKAWNTRHDEIDDLKRLITAWRSIADKAGNEVAAHRAIINKLNARCDRDDKLIFQMKDEISKFKAKNNVQFQKLEASEKRVQTARSLLDDAFSTDGYDCQGVNQAHRVLSLGKPPKKTKLEE